jgi:superfamily II DNA or RNA helicase
MCVALVFSAGGAFTSALPAVTVFMLNDFRDAHIEYPNSFADLYQAKVKQKPKPDPHQIKAIEDATSGLKTSDRGQMIMACGTGKTFTTLWIKEALEAHTTLVLLPSLSLLSQTMREWAWAGNTDFDILNVCSDKSVGKKTEDMDPADAPFPVTSDVVEIAKFLSSSNPKVIFCTYQSSDLIAQAQSNPTIPAFDLAVADEAHRCAGSADAGFATILHSTKIRASKRLFTTATPRYFGKAVVDVGKSRDLEVLSMDDETVFGPVIHKLTFGEAIYRELLTDYQVVIVGVDAPMVKLWIDEQEIVSINPDQATDARTLAAKIGLIKAIKDYDLKRVISFHSRVKGAKDFSEGLDGIIKLIALEHRPDGSMWSDYVSGKMNAGDRKAKIDKLKRLEAFDRGILTNARCLAEGVDVPSLDGVAFIDPRGSQTEIIQAVGRAIRKVRGAAVQKNGTIVIPVFIEEGDDVDASIEASNFKPVWDVLKALRAHDEVLADTLDQYRTNMAKQAGKPKDHISDKIIFDLPVYVDQSFSDAIRTVVVRACTTSWEFWFNLLLRFKAEFGHANPPMDFLYEFGPNEKYKLGNWLSNQRSKQIDLVAKRRLKSIGVSLDPYKENWELTFEYYKNYVAKNNHDIFNKGHTFFDQFTNLSINMQKWVGRNRSEFKNNILSDEKIARFNGIGFVWVPLDNNWEKGYNKLKSFIQQNGRKKPPVYYTEKDGFNLYHWYSVNLRSLKKDLLPDDRKEKLLALNINFQKEQKLTFDELRQLLFEKKIHTTSNFKEFRLQSPQKKQIPTDPVKFYGECKSWLHLFDTQDKKKEWLSYGEARSIVRNLSFPTVVAFKNYDFKSKGIIMPSQPHLVYKDKGWIDVENFFGEGLRHNKFVSYEEAKDYVAQNGIMNHTEWKKFKKENIIPSYIPKKPENAYLNKGWVSASDFFGKGARPSDFLDFISARTLARSLKINKQTGWTQFTKSSSLPAGVPKSPAMVYKSSGWIDWKDWLGTSIIDFDEAKKYIADKNISNWTAWQVYKKSSVFPIFLPQNPDGYYQKSGTWTSWPDFLSVKDKKVVCSPVDDQDDD